MSSLAPMIGQTLFLLSEANVGPCSFCLFFVLFGLCGAFCVFVLACLVGCGWFNFGLTLRAWVHVAWIVRQS